MSTTYSNSSLYVGDLQPEVNETFLYEVFRSIGPIISIKVCRDTLTNKSLGYAYVNFQNAQDAAKAIEVLNFALVKDKPMRIMYVQRDPSVRKSGLGNIFIKNLEKSIDNKSLYETFSYFGNILSCKVCTRKFEVIKDGKATIEEESLGYGFVHFETQEAAQLAINKVNGMLIEGKKVSVAAFVRKQERMKSTTSNLFTNVYVKDLDPSVDSKGLENAFKKYGEITSCFVALDKETGKSKCFGFLNFTEPESAKKAVGELDGKQIEGLSTKGKTLYVSKAEKKEERRIKLVKLYESKRLETQGHNLYVKNLEDGTDEAKLKQIFGQYGTITSLTIMKDEKGTSKGFGFVCFEKAEDALKALNELHNKLFGSKPLYVNLAQRKDQRKKELEELHLQRQGLQRQGQMYPQQMYGQRQFNNYPNQVKPKWGQKNTKGGNQKGGQVQNKDKKGGNQKNQKSQNQNNSTQQQGDIKFNQNVRNPKQQTQQKVPKVQESKSQDNALSTHLSQMSPRSQKQTLGDHLYPLVLSLQPHLASKITGMLLEMDNADILHLIESSEALNAKVQEAVGVLKIYEEKEKK